MNSMCEISVIIPIYNVEKYLEKCVDSVLNQIFKNIEIILVNDGSTDSSGEIMESYQTKFPAIVKGYSKMNGGLSSARNYGLERVNGKYVTFLDSDDYLDEDYLETLYNLAEMNNSDMVCGGQRKIDAEGEILKTIRYQLDKNPDTIFRKFHVSGKLYKREFITRYNAHFAEGKLYEDNPFNMLMLFVAKNFRLIDYNGYNQLVREGSITTKKIQAEQLPYQAIEDAVKFITGHKELCNNYEVFEYTVMSFFTYFIFQANKSHGYLKQGKSRTSDIEVVLEFCDFVIKILEQYMPKYYKNRNLNVFKNRELQLTQRIGTTVFAILCRVRLLKTFTKLYYKIG